MHDCCRLITFSAQMIKNATPTRIPSCLSCGSPTPITHTRRATSPRIMHKHLPNYDSIQSELLRNGCGELKPQPRSIPSASFPKAVNSRRNFRSQKSPRGFLSDKDVLSTGTSRLFACKIVSRITTDSCRDIDEVNCRWIDLPCRYSATD